MSYLFTLAFRNVQRNKKRTIITFCAISFGLAAIIIGKSLMDGVDLQAQKNLINTDTAHLKIYAAGYFEERNELPLTSIIDEPKQIIPLIKSVPEIKAVAARVNFSALMIKGTQELGCKTIGIDPKDDPQVFNLRRSLKEGRFLSKGSESMLAGVDLAQDFGLKIGDLVTIEMLTADSARNALDLEVVGLFDTGNPLIDNNTVFIPLDLAQQALNIDTGVTEIAVKLYHINQLRKTENKIDQLLSSLNTNSQSHRWDEIAGDFLEISKIKIKAMGIISLIMIIIATLGITNTMLMAMIERTKEIGMMASMGMKIKDIMTLFILEGGVIGFFGSILGCLMGIIGSIYLEIYGWDISYFGEEIKQIAAAAYPIKDVYYADLSWSTVIFVLVFGIFVSIVASSYAAWRAARLDPAEALRYV